MIITIAGLPGSGKSTVRNILAEKLGLKKYSVGDMRGKMALERGMTIDEFNVLGMTEDFTDKEADAYQAKIGETEDNFIIDGRLSWHFIPHSVKIFLTVDLDEAGRRIYEARRQSPDDRKDEVAYATPQEAKLAITNRIAVDDARYQKWYGISYTNPANFDLVVDTTSIPAEKVAEQILTFLQDSATLRP